MASSFTPRSSTPWLRTSRKPSESSDRAARPSSGVTWLAWLTCVCIARPTPRSKAFLANRPKGLLDLRLQEVLREPHQALGGEPDVADVVDVEQRVDEGLERLDGQVGDVAAAHHHVAHLSSSRPSRRP